MTNDENVPVDQSVEQEAQPENISPDGGDDQQQQQRPDIPADAVNLVPFLLEQDKITVKEDINKRIASEIAQLSKSLAQHKRIMSFDISYEELPKTVTKKIRRDAVSRMAGH